jgi:urease accessory protein
LVSPALPVGAYAYSQGLEYAVHAGWVSSETSALEWLEDLSRYSVGSLDLPILLRLRRAWAVHDEPAVRSWNSQLIASRETAESRAEERHMGGALARVLIELEVGGAGDWRGADAAFATLFALAAARWNIAERATLSGYLWSWTENQVLGAIKLIPLGQSAGQRLLHRLTQSMPATIERACAMDEAQIGVGVIAPMLAGAWHETQYTRLFRS